MTLESSLFAIAGILVAVGLIAIRLLFRNRFVAVPWAAMEFLQEAYRKHQSRIRWRDTLLMATRIFALIACGYTFSRPYWTSSHPEEVQQELWIFDNSQSMRLSTLNSTLLDVAKNKATKSLETLADTCRVAVIPFIDSTEIQPELRLKSEVHSALDAIELTNSPGDIRELWLRVERLRNLNSIQLRFDRIRFFTDLQNTMWGTDRSIESLQDFVRTCSVPVELIRVDHTQSSNTGASNLFVSDLKTTEKYVVPGMTVRVNAT
ncbi:MAG: hypothetical protein FJ267_10720, partial [Planctomycetes bacterium]|nr:hypothetical protein [Planctomycetota bacterium]